MVPSAATGRERVQWEQGGLRQRAQREGLMGWVDGRSRVSRVRALWVWQTQQRQWATSMMWWSFGEWGVTGVPITSFCWAISIFQRVLFAERLVESKGRIMYLQALPEDEL